jgi:hypothetical protein
VAINFAIAFPILAQHENAAFAALAISVAYGVVLALHMRMYARESGGYSVLIPRPTETINLLKEMATALVFRRRSVRLRES